MKIKHLCGRLAVAAVLFAPCHSSFGQAELTALRKEVEAARATDLRVAPPVETREKMLALLERAKGRNEVPLAELFLLRKAIVATWFYQGDSARALEMMDALMRDLEASPVKGTDTDMEIRGNHAALLNLVGRGKEALARMREVQAYFLAHGGKQNENYIAATAEIGAIQYSMGEAIEAEAASAEAVTLARSAKVDPSTLVRYWQNWATLLNNVGRTADGVRELEAVSRYAEEKLGPDHVLTTQALRNLGTELNNAGRYAEAITVIRRTLASTDTGSPEQRRYRAYALNTLAYALLGSEGPRAALPVYQAALAAARQAPDSSTPHLPGELTLNLAQAHESLGEHAEARRLRTEILAEMAKAVGTNHATYGRASADLAASLLLAGEHKAALAHFADASRIMARVHKPTGKLRLQNAVLEGMTRYMTGDQGGYAEARAAVDIARDAVMANMVAPTQTVKNAAQYGILFSDFAELAHLAGKYEDAFEAMQLAQLGDLDSAGAAYLARAAATDAGGAELFRRAQDKSLLLGRLRTERAAKVGEARAADVAALDAQMADAERELATLRTEIDRVFPAYSRLLRPEPQTLAHVRQKLPDGDALLMSQSGRNGVLSLVLTKSAVASSLSPGSRVDTHALVTRMRESIDGAMQDDAGNAAFDVDAASRLYTKLVPKSLERPVASAGTLHVQAGGALARVPFAALVTQRMPGATRSTRALRAVPWLIKRQAVTTPVTLALLGKQDAARNRGRFAGIGAPALQGRDQLTLAIRGLGSEGRVDAAQISKLPPLPRAGNELVRMKESFDDQDGLLLVGNQATRTAVLGADLSKYGVIAFATHGLVSGELRGVTEPGLVMTPEAGKPDSGLLTASDVASMRLDADWVILTACNTAAAESPGAPMYSGLARAFVFAGARALLLSQWPVRDDVAAQLGVSTVKGFRGGLGRAEALRKAQLNILNDDAIAQGAHPAAWAPFVLIGE